MQRLSGFIGGIVVTVALLGTLVALGKSNNLLGQLQPVVIDIQQAVPIKAVVTIPGTDEKPVTTTLPLTVSVDLRVKVDSSKQVDIQVLGQPTPVVEVTSQNQNSQVDNQGPFAIKIGDKIGDGIPVAGAGRIETSGTEDVYIFTAEPNQEVYFDVQAYNATLNNDNTPYNDLYIGVYDEGNQEIFTRVLTQGDPGRYTLTKGGMYTVIIGNKTSDVTGAYKLQLWNAPADQFAISIGDTVADGKPQAGAGKIETPGAQDVYTFTAEPNQEVYFDVQAYNATLNNDSSPYNDLYIGVYDEDNQEIFTRALTQDDQRKYTLTKGGMYTIIIGNKTSDVTGSYKLQIRNGK